MQSRGQTRLSRRSTTMHISKRIWWEEGRESYWHISTSFHTNPWGTSPLRTGRKRLERNEVRGRGEVTQCGPQSNYFSVRCPEDRWESRNLSVRNALHLCSAPPQMCRCIWKGVLWLICIFIVICLPPPRLRWVDLLSQLCYISRMTITSWMGDKLGVLCESKGLTWEKISWRDSFHGLINSPVVWPTFPSPQIFDNLF